LGCKSVGNHTRGERIDNYIQHNEISLQKSIGAWRDETREKLGSMAEIVASIRDSGLYISRCHCIFQ
jgi:hypothetical protein